MTYPPTKSIGYFAWPLALAFAFMGMIGCENPIEPQQTANDDTFFKADENTIGMWHFNEGEGDSTFDASSNNNHAKINGATWVDGKYGAGLQFDGIDDFVEVYTSKSLTPPGAALTIEAIVKPLSIPDDGAGGKILYRANNDEYTAQFQMYLDSNGTVNGDMVTSQYNTCRSQTTSTVLKPGTWYVLKLVYDGDNMTVFVDGNDEGGCPKAQEFESAHTDLQIGNAYMYGEYKKYFNGVIDELRISSIAR